MFRKKMYILIAFIIVFSLLTGCNMRTVEDMYSPPKRPEAYTNLQTQIDKIMVGQEYQAPLSGENRQAVQSADLDGDGVPEYLVFAKSNSDKPLQLHIFSGDGEKYTLLDTIESTGSAFDLVEYRQFDGRKGMEIIVGRQVSDQVVRSVCVYTLLNGQLEQVLAANYSKFVCTDMDKDKVDDLLVLRPGDTDTDNGIAELYGIDKGTIIKSQEVNMSEPTSSIKRIMVGKLHDGVDAVYVASDVDGNAMITDVYAVVDKEFANVSFSNESGTSVQTLRNYYVYADDIDDDGVLELPSLINMVLPENIQSGQMQYLIRWYAMSSDGSEHEKMFTYHNYQGGWYMQMRTELVNRIFVEQMGNGFSFNLWDENFESYVRLSNIYVLTGQKREEQATINNRFVLYRTESTVYAADLDVAAATYEISKDEIINSFHLILQDWNTGET